MHFHSRRGFLTQTLGASWMAASLMEKSVLRAAQARADAQSAPQPILFDLQRMADGVYAALARPQAMINSNAVVFENATDVLIVDTHARPSAVAALTAQIRKQVTPKPIRYVVNTHFHGDHVQGNPMYRKLAPQVDFLSSTTTRDLMVQLAAPRLKASVEQAAASLDRYRASLAEAKTAHDKNYYQEMISQTTAYIAEMKDSVPEIPNITFDRDLVIHDKSHEIHLAFRGRAHTAGDVVVFCPQTKTMASGDLLEGLMPNIADGYPREWPRTLRALLDFPFDLAAGGHGDVQHGRDRLHQMAAYIEELTGLVDAGKRQGRDIAQLQASIDPGSLKSLGGPYRDFLFSQMQRYSAASAVTPPAQSLISGLKGNIRDIYNTLDHA
jgi:glyoxylase-like metal-dependent hydrolase (beta-lactamase superfamily II)